MIEKLLSSSEKSVVEMHVKRLRVPSQTMSTEPNEPKYCEFGNRIIAHRIVIVALVSVSHSFMVFLLIKFGCSFDVFASSPSSLHLASGI